MKKTTAKQRLEKYAFGEVIEDPVKPTRIPLPDYKNPESRKAYAVAFKQKYAPDALPGFGDIALRANEVPGWGSGTSKTLAIKYGKAMGLDPALFYASAMIEGQSGLYPGANPKLGGKVQTTGDKDYPISALWNFGLDSLPDKIDSLVEKGYLPEDFEEKNIKWNLDDNIDEGGMFKTADAGIQAKAAMMRSYYDEFDNYTKKNKINLTPEQRDYFALAHFNSGQHGYELLNSYNKAGLLKDNSFIDKMPNINVGFMYKGKPMSKEASAKLHKQIYGNVAPRLKAARGLREEGLFAAGGEVGSPWMSLVQQIPGIANSIMGLFENNPNSYSRQPTLNADTMRQMVTPYAMGGLAGLDEETLSQLQMLAAENSMTIEELLQQLQDSQTEQESTEEEVNDEDEDQFAYGGIHINPKNKGKFTASAKKAGMGVQSFAAKVLANKSSYSPTQVKRANFARNAAKWKHAMGGETSIEVEGDEVLETPDGQMTKMKGPSHEQGGIDVTVPNGTKIYSDRLMIDGKTMQERKVSREKTMRRIEKMMSKNPTDKISSNTYNRMMKGMQMEEAQDMAMQKMMNKVYNQQQPKEEFAYGGVPGNPYFNSSFYSTLLNAPLYDEQDSWEPDPGYPIQGMTPIEGLKPLDSYAWSTPQLPDAPTGDTSSIKKTSPNNTLGAGDYIGIAGNLFNAIAPIVNTKNAAAANKPNVNRFLGFGRESLETNQQAQDILARTKASQLTDIDTSSNSARLRNRNSASSINTLRALDTVTDIQTTKAKQAANDSFTKTMMGLLGQRGQLENIKDRYEMTGEAQRDVEDKMDRDNYYSNMAQNLTNFGTNIQGIGRALNVAKSNKIDKNLISQLSQYGLGFDNEGNLISTNR